MSDEPQSDSLDPRTWDRLGDLAANLADLSTNLRAAARAAGRASAALWGMNDPESDDE